MLRTGCIKKDALSTISTIVYRKNVHMYFIGVTEGKIENSKKEGKMKISNLKFHLHYTLCLPEGVHKL